MGLALIAMAAGGSLFVFGMALGFLIDKHEEKKGRT